MWRSAKPRSEPTGASVTASEWDNLKKTIDKLDDDAKRRLIQEVAATLEPAPLTAEAQRENLLRLIRELESLPPEGPDDGWSNRQHDDVIYGERGS